MSFSLLTIIVLITYLIMCLHCFNSAACCGDESWGRRLYPRCDYPQPWAGHMDYWEGNGSHSICIQTCAECCRLWLKAMVLIHAFLQWFRAPGSKVRVFI